MNGSLNEVAYFSASPRLQQQCSSGNPCLECTRRESACIFDESSDKRRKSYLTKMEKELNYYQKFLDDFFEALRISKDDDVDHIINIVRSGASTSEIQLEVNGVLRENNSSRPAA